MGTNHLEAMAVFDNIEDMFQNVRELGECCQTLVTLATAIGSIAIIFHTLKFIFKLIQGKIKLQTRRVQLGPCPNSTPDRHFDRF